MQSELRESSGIGHVAVAADWQRPEFSAYIETIPENALESSDNNQEEDLDKILKQRIMVFWRNHGEALRAST